MALVLLLHLLILASRLTIDHLISFNPFVVLVKLILPSDNVHQTEGDPGVEHAGHVDHPLLHGLRNAVVVRRLLLPARPAPPTLGGHSVDVVPRQLVDDRPLCIFREVHRKVLTNNLSVLLQTLKSFHSPVDMFLHGFRESVVTTHVIGVVLRCRVVLFMALRALKMLLQGMLVGVQGIDNRAHTGHLAFTTPDRLRPQVFADEVHRVHLVHVQHVVEQLDRVVKLLLANAALSRSHNVLRCVDHTSVGLALRHNGVRNGTCGFATGQLVLDQAKELDNPRVLFKGLLVHRVMRLGHPGDKKLYAFHAIVPPGCPLGEEDHDVHWVTFSGLFALGHRARELVVFVKEDRFELGIRHPLALCPY